VFFSPSLGIAAGLPHRFETGIRYYAPYVFEGNVRHQLNPRSFSAFDMSVNFHMGTLFSNWFRDMSNPYFKYGLTLSRQISGYQPFVSFYLNKNYNFDDIDDDFLDYSTLCFGLAIPYKENLIIPECNYLMGNDGNGIISIGIGIRAALRKKAAAINKP
jgi:hypothetical protein